LKEAEFDGILIHVEQESPEIAIKAKDGRWRGLAAISGSAFLPRRPSG
jgi:hypothetical protein